MKNRKTVSTLGTTLSFRIVVPLFAIAGLSMGNQSCQSATTTARVLKMDIEIGTLKARSVKLPNGEVIDFPYVANSLFHGLLLGLMDRDPDLGKAGKEVFIVGLGSVRSYEPLGERSLCVQGGRILDPERNPGANFRREIEDFIFLSTEHHLLHEKV